MSVLSPRRFQLARLGSSVAGGYYKDRGGWLRDVHSARDALAIRRAAIQLEEAVYGEEMNWGSQLCAHFLLGKSGRGRLTRMVLCVRGAYTPFQYGTVILLLLLNLRFLLH